MGQKKVIKWVNNPFLHHSKVKFKLVRKFFVQKQTKNTTYILKLVFFRVLLQGSTSVCIVICVSRCFPIWYLLYLRLRSGEKKYKFSLVIAIVITLYGIGRIVMDPNRPLTIVCVTSHIYLKGKKVEDDTRD
jgi:hypothetical protein